jgi:hypothetical protein
MPFAPHPDLEKQNRFAVTTELSQVGAEISLSHRFFQNALLPAIHVSLSNLEELNTYQGGPGLRGNFKTVGGAWIVNKTQRVAGQQPDVVLKHYMALNKSEVRLVGEL